MVCLLTSKPSVFSRYLKEFRVEQCPLFLQHKCTQHRPFTCFHWHFMNQRRRRPVRRRDGTFNYSPDNYCTKYDETTGICPDGDEWVHLFWLTLAVIFYALWVWRFKRAFTVFIIKIAFSRCVCARNPRKSHRLVVRKFSISHICYVNKNSMWQWLHNHTF